MSKYSKFIPLQKWHPAKEIDYCNRQYTPLMTTDDDGDYYDIEETDRVIEDLGEALDFLGYQLVGRNLSEGVWLWDEEFSRLFVVPAYPTDEDKKEDRKSRGDFCATLEEAIERAK